MKFILRAHHIQAQRVLGRLIEGKYSEVLCAGIAIAGVASSCGPTPW